tara:strand:+ start:484 stop:1392 length:909 start_codon:yes stop_codon:yes gene_type:complete
MQSETDALVEAVMLGNHPLVLQLANNAPLEVINNTHSLRLVTAIAAAALAWRGPGNPSFQHLLDNKADVNEHSGLAFVSIYGHVDVITTMLDAKATVDHQSSRADGATLDGMTALSCAVGHGHHAATLVLLDAKADPGITHDEPPEQGYYGTTILMVAAGYGYTNIGRALIAAKADPGQTSSDGTTALHLAALGGHGTMALRLLEAGADINARTDEGITALLNACAENYGEVATLLLHLGAETGHEWTSPSGEVFGPQTIAEARGHTAIVEILADEAHRCEMRRLTEQHKDEEATWDLNDPI